MASTEIEYKKPDTTYPLSRIEVLTKEGGGGGDDPGKTATEEDIDGIIDNIWADGGES